MGRALPSVPRDPWSDPVAADPAEIARMAAQLEDRAGRPDQMQVNALLQDVLAPQPGEHILEVGCGTGALARPQAARLAPQGVLVGLDVAPGMAQAAQRLAAGDAAIHGYLGFVIGRGDALPLSAGAFDAAFAARLLIHVQDAAGVVREMARVVRIGGRVVLAEWDWETVTVDHPDHNLTRHILNWRCDNQGGDNWRGRQLAGLAAAAGLHDVTVMPLVTVARDGAAALTLSLWRAADNARDAGAINPGEHAGWTGDLRRYIAEQRFFASIVYFVVRGVRAL